VVDARRVVVEASAHADVPFEVIVDDTAVDRADGPPPLARVMLTLDEAADLLDAPDLPGLLVERVDVPPSPGAKTDLVIQGRLRPDGGLLVQLAYASDRFERTTVEQIARLAERVLTAAADASGTAVGRLAILDPAERRWLVEGLNDTARPSPRHTRIDELVWAAADRHADRVAVVEGGRAHTYADLVSRAESFAERLRGVGVLPGDAVAVELPRGADHVIAVLGVLRAGGCYVPIDPGAPPVRRQLLLADAKVRVLVVADGTSHAGALELRPGDADPVPPARRVGAASADDPGAGAPESSAPDPGLQPASVMYTSGSTGRPKGVVVPHRAIVRLVVGTDYVSLGPDDVVAFASNPAFDAATFEIFGALAHGARLAVIAPDELLDVERLARRLRDDAVTTMFLTTALFHAVARTAPTTFSTLRCLLVGGEALDAAAVRAVVAAGPPARLLNVYGPTEATTFSSWHEIGGLPPGARTVSIGRPVANTTLHVLDRSGAPVPRGIVGELAIGGDGLALGYLDDAALTAERFVPDHLAPRGPGARLYRTGDRVRRRAGGEIEFVGRTDRQLKLRGFRIEPGEIEAVLGEHPDVAGCVVSVRAGVHAVLVAHVVAPASVAPEALRAFAAERLPAPLVPTHVVRVDQFPLTANGKVDVARLPEPMPAHASAAPTAPTAPSAPTSMPTAPAPPVVRAVPSSTGEAATAADVARVVSVFRAVLGRTDIGPDDDFFDVGGNSIAALELMTRVGRALAADVPLAALYRARTPTALAARCRVAGLPPGPTVELVRLHDDLPAPGPPVVLFPLVDGESFVYLPLVRHLRRRHPVLALRATDDAGAATGVGTIEEAGRRFSELIAHELGAGACVFAGFSFGGVTAYETACRARDLGVDVAHLVLIDSLYPEPRPTRPQIYARMLAEGGAAAVVERLGRAGSARLRWARRAVHEARLGDESTVVERRAMAAKVEAGARAVRAWSPASYHGALTVVSAISSRVPGVGGRPGQRWASHAPGAVVVRVRADHLGPRSVMKEPQVAEVAQIILDRGSGLRPLRDGR
jgi:amino acid adenylation domain-containing protein